MSLRSERRKAKLSQGDAAQLCGIRQQRLSHYECGIREPKLDVLKRLSKVYGCTIDALLENRDVEDRFRKKNVRRKIAKTA